MIRPYDDGKVIIKTVLILLFILFIVGYGIFKAQKLFSGPKINVSSVHSGQVVTGDGSVNIEGQAQNISSISLNDRPIYVDEKGAFSEKLLLFPGYNIIKLFGKDKFGASVEKRIEMIYKAN